MGIIKLNKDNVKEANELLTKLIHDEKQYDDNINLEYIVNNYYENMIDKDNCYLAFIIDNNIIMGYIYGFIQDNGNAYINKIIQLDALYIKEEYRNKGYAKLLIDSLKKWSIQKGIKNIELKVCNNNQNAINLYHQYGFKDTKTIMKLDI